MQVPLPSEEHIAGTWDIFVENLRESGCPIVLILFMILGGLILWLAVFRRKGLSWHDIAMRLGKRSDDKQE